MKVYSWETLIVTILICGIGIIHQCKNIISVGEVSSYFYLIFWIYLDFKGLWVSFTKEGSEEDEFKEFIYIKATRKLFGSWGPIITWLGYIIIILAGAIVKFIPTLNYLSIVLLFLGLIYNILIAIIIRKQRKKYF